MSISVKHQELHVRNVEEHISKTDLSLEKHQDYLLEQENQLTSQYPSSIVENVDMSMPSSYHKNSQNWTRYIYDGLQSMIYGGSSSDE